MSKAPRGRRVPPKARGARSARPADDFDALDELDASDAPDASDTPVEAAARRTRAQNRAAKRAASGVRPKTVRGQGRRASARRTRPLIALAVAAVAIGLAVVCFANPFGSPGASPSPSAGAATDSPYGDGTCPTSEPDVLGPGESSLVTIKTEKGDIVIKVDGFLSPIAAGNFVALAECKFYDGVVFHRTAALDGGTPFVIQGGDPLGTGTRRPGLHDRRRAGRDGLQARHGRDGPVAAAAQPGLAVLHRPVGRGGADPPERQHLRDLRRASSAAWRSRMRSSGVRWAGDPHRARSR